MVNFSLAQHSDSMISERCFFTLQKAAVWALSSLMLLSVYAQADVNSIRLWRAPDHTRLVFDMASASEHKVFTLQNPDRLVVDISSAKMKADLKTLVLDGTPISRLRHGRRGRSDLRVVLDLNTGIKPKSFFLPKQAAKPDRLVVDLHPQKAGQATKKSAIAVSSNETPKRNIIIAIDAGHGGEDPGAIGPRKLMEKDVVLKISQQLKWAIDKEPGYEAFLVRDGDYYISHKKRRDKARTHRADFFVSIHADAFNHPSASGASVYALSERGATSEAARFLASRENEADLIGGVGSVSLNDKDKVLASVLLDLSMTANLANSLDIGSQVLTSMGKMTRLHSRKVEQAGFMVLKSPDVPSILVETGYISNPGEAKKLNTSSYRKKIARAIFQGVKSYFFNSPPPGSLVAWRKLQQLAPDGRGNLHYIIARGDTLSEIAQRYNISVTQLKHANNLKGTTIRIGQKLKIPTS